MQEPLEEIASSPILPESCDARVKQLHNYWRSIHPGGGRLPGRQHVEPLHLPELLPWIWLVDVQREPQRLRYRLIGTGLVRAMGRDHTGRWLDEAQDGVPKILDYGDFLAAAAGALRFCRRVPDFPVAERPVLMERLLLPLARDGSVVDMLLAITVYRRSDGAAM